MSQKFQSKLLSMGPNGAWTKMRIPFNVAEVFGKNSQVKVKGTLNGFPFQNSLMPAGDGTHTMHISKELQVGSGAKPGDIVKVTLEEDKSERVVTVPPELASLLKKNKSAAETYNAFSYSHRKEYANWISSAKKPETRVARAEKAVPMILAKKKLS